MKKARRIATYLMGTASVPLIKFQQRHPVLGFPLLVTGLALANAAIAVYPGPPESWWHDDEEAFDPGLNVDMREPLGFEGVQVEGVWHRVPDDAPLYCAREHDPL